MNDKSDNNIQADDKEFENSLAYRIGDLENYYADNILSEDLVEIYAEVQKNCEDFRENIFFKNLDILENSLGTFSKPKNNKKGLNSEEYQYMIHQIKTPEDLLSEFTKKAMSADTLNN